MWFPLRRRGLALVVLSAGVCLATPTCIEQAQLTLLRIGVSSFTLPVNQAIAGGYTILNNLLTQLVLGG